MANNTEQRVTSLEAAMVELAQSQTRTGQRLDEFISQSARLLGDHGSRLSRTEAQIESLVSLFQAADRRLNRLEAWTQAFDQRMLQLADSQALLINSQQQLAESQRQVMSRMDDLIAVVRERL